MAYSLDTFAADCKSVISQGFDKAQLEKVKGFVEKALTDDTFVDQYFGPGNTEERKILYEDPELGFCILSHVYEGAKDSSPHDHGPSWAIYGQVDGTTEMTDWALLEPPKDGEPGKVELVETYTLEPGMARVYGVGDLHSPSQKDTTKLLRMEGRDMASVKRDKFEAV